jgi:hypothetical protein
MSLGVTHNQFRQSWQQIRQQWQKTTGCWNDPVRWRFEQDFWQPLENDMSAALQAMERLAHVIAQAQQNVH